MSTHTTGADAIDSEVRIVGIATLLLALIAIGAYSVWFALVHELPLSESPQTWGEFGDYLGGLLNPVVALAALYWLTRSVRIQKTELAETKRALADSAEAAQLHVRVAALTALTQASMTEVQIHRMHIEMISNQLTGSNHSHIRSVSGEEIDAQQAIATIKSVSSRIEELLVRKYEYEAEINRIAERH